MRGANPDRYGDELGQIQTDADSDGCRFRQTVQAAADSNSSTFRPRIQQIQIQADKSSTKQSHMHDQTISDIVRELFYDPEEEDAYMHQLLVRIRHIQDRVRDIYEQVCRAYIWYDLLGSEEDKIMYAKMSSLMEARAETLKLELTECLVNMASEFKRGEM
ncbi:hypothetical protein Tco_1028960 [Tanacetum coccineum]|uniref:Uncharacterized protein n=1 Tax=Tanacetum coccineum TaxID=301880 RepID=A0ABQ5G2K2_9ASTR